MSKYIQVIVLALTVGLGCSALSTSAEAWSRHGYYHHGYWHSGYYGGYYHRYHRCGWVPAHYGRDGRWHRAHKVCWY